VAKSSGKLRVIPLGGLGEVGKNITVFEYEDDIFVVDCGSTFPDDDMLGIDLVLPDITYLIKNKERLRGIVITHGHEDHIGGLPYILKEVKVPVFGSRLALGLIEYKLEEHGILSECELIPVKAGQTIELGAFKIEFIKSTHSIVDSMALAIYTPVGTIIHTSDFKVDYTPISGHPIDLLRIAEIGRKGVLLLLCDSTNVERPGYTMSERTIGRTFDELFCSASSRIIIATFASNIDRIQQIVNAAVKYDRKIALCGRSMINVCNKAMELGYLTIPNETLINIESAKNYTGDKLVIITTGSQGEPMSALSRMAAGEYKLVDIVPGDLAIISSTPIPGNEKSVSYVVNELFKKGAEVIYESLAEVHVSGHACQEELKLIHKLVNPKYFMPVHGEYRHLKKHADLAKGIGMDENNVLIMEIGQVLEIDNSGFEFGERVPSGIVLVDGLGIGDVGNVVLRDRKHLSEDGMIIAVATIQRETGAVINEPDILTRGFASIKESEEFLSELKQICLEAIQKSSSKNVHSKKSKIKEALREYIYQKSKRTPMIIPVIVEI